MYNSDIIIIGSGIAGLMVAIKLSERNPDFQISLLTKSSLFESNSIHAQGGIASVSDKLKDSFESHINDTLKCGGGYCNPEIVSYVVKSAPKRIEELMKYGVSFTKDKENNLELAMEGGHSQARIIHSKDKTGEEIILSLISKIKSFPNVKVFENHFCMKLILDNFGVAQGVLALDSKNNEIVVFNANCLVLASGGMGQIYKHTTNPEIATGDAIAMGIREHALLSNIRFVQFHPTALYEKGKSNLFLISEALRGFGAHVINKKGERFLFNSDERGELSTRDIVSKAIFNELKDSGDDFVYLDTRHLDLHEFQNHFPTIFSYLLSKGIQPSKDLIPIVPAAHYHCGGIKVNRVGQTSIEKLYAIGECAETGLHGSNRLASNSLLEALVFAHDISEHISEKITKKNIYQYPSIGEIKIDRTHDLVYKEWTKDIKSIMSGFATIASSKEDLKEAITRIGNIENQLKEIKNEGIVSESKIIFENTLLVSKEIVNEMKKSMEKKLIINRIKISEIYSVKPNKTFKKEWKIIN